MNNNTETSNDYNKILKGSDVKTGKPITIKILKNPSKAPNFGSEYGQDVEPSGNYVTQYENFIPKGWKIGEVTFKNPLVIDVTVDTLIEWKRDLSKKYENKKGKSLTDALKKEGYDGIITREDSELGEIIAFDNSKQTIENSEPNSLNEFTYPPDYKSWKRKNVTLRGMKEVGVENDAGAMFGRGLYTAFLSNRDLAKQYGDVNFVVNAIPKKPKIVNNINEAEIFLQQLVTNFCKKHNVPRSTTFFHDKTEIAKEMLAIGYDGLVVKGREMVNYTPPENVKYFKTESELYDYYNIVVKNNKSLNESMNIDALDKKDKLNPQFFDGDKLKTVERGKLLGLTKRYISHLELDDVKIKDIVMTGSNTNYNYTDDSDVDIHILVDYSKINKDQDLVKDLFMSKKDNWSAKYEVTVHKHPIELFVQDYNQPREWSAEYSLVKNKWVKKPKEDDSEINDVKIEKEAKEYMDEIDSVIKSYTGKNSDKVLNELEKIRVKIKNMRTDSLNSEKTEFAEGNLVFKLLRNNNYLDKMQEFKKKIFQDQYGLKEGKVLVVKEEQYKKIKNSLANK